MIWPCVGTVWADSTVGTSRNRKRAGNISFAFIVLVTKVIKLGLSGIFTR